MKQDKIWTDSLSNALGLDNPWDELEKPLRKFICFGEGGDDGGAGDGDADDDDMGIAPGGPTGPGSASSGGGGAFGGPASSETMGYGEFSGFGGQILLKQQQL